MLVIDRRMFSFSSYKVSATFSVIFDGLEVCLAGSEGNDPGISGVGCRIVGVVVGCCIVGSEL